MTRYRMAALAALLLCSCSTVLNPYQSSFNCPGTENGKCVSVQTAYRESLNPLVKSDGEECTDCGKGRPDASGAPADEKEYRAALLSRLTGLLREPETPMVASPQVLRVLLMPYKGDGGELFMPRYAYFFVDRPSWILDGYLVEKGDD
ncbi:MAG: TraV family lipoprotein [Geobacteraceae bacterium]